MGLCGRDDLVLALHYCFRISLQQIKVPLKSHHLLRNITTKSQPNILLHEIPFTNQFDLIYIGRVKIGNSRRSFRTLFDSGSSDIWFVSNECRSDFCEGRQAYRINTPLHLTEHIRMRYAAGTVSGYLVSDEVKIGELAIQSQYFAAAESVNISVHTYPLSHFKTPRRNTLSLMA